MAEPDPGRTLALYAQLSRRIYERLGGLARALRTGAAGNADLQQLIDHRNTNG